MRKKSAISKTGDFGRFYLLTQRGAIIAGVALTLVVAYLHWTFMRHAGAFWRDEINSIDMAAMISISDIWNHLKFDSFPILPSLILRLWISLGGGSESGLRVFGFMVGILILMALWLNGRFLGFRVPLLALSLFALGPMAIQIGDSIRPYGTGILFILLTIGLLWKAAEQGRAWQIIAGAVTAVLSVQCLYQNVFFLAAIIFAGIVVTVRNRQWKRAILLAATGVAAATSILPYLQQIKRTQDWAVILKSRVGFPDIYQGLVSALSAGGRPVLAIWAGLFLITIGVLFYFCRRRKECNQTHKDRVLFCAIVMIVCTTALMLFLRFMQVYITMWYYLPLIAIGAVSLDAILGNSNLGIIVRVVLAISAGAATFNAAHQSAYARQTNIDIVASIVARSAAKDDLILVNPWFYAVSFQRYYRGEAHFTTLPPIGDYRIHRYDLVKAKMASANPIDTVLSETSRTLSAGHNVWIIGQISSLPEGVEPLSITPAPNSPNGWYVIAYMLNWEQQFLYLVQSHSVESLFFPPVTNKPVNRFEDCSIEVVRWKQ